MYYLRIEIRYRRNFKGYPAVLMLASSLELILMEPCDYENWRSHSRTWKSLATRDVYKIEAKFERLPHIIDVAQYTGTNVDIAEVIPL